MAVKRSGYLCLFDCVVSVLECFRRLTHDVSLSLTLVGSVSSEASWTDSQGERTLQSKEKRDCQGEERMDWHPRRPCGQIHGP